MRIALPAVNHRSVAAIVGIISSFPGKAAICLLFDVHQAVNSIRVDGCISRVQLNQAPPSSSKHRCVTECRKFCCAKQHVLFFSATTTKPYSRILCSVHTPRIHQWKCHLLAVVVCQGYNWVAGSTVSCSSNPSAVSWECYLAVCVYARVCKRNLLS